MDTISELRKLWGKETVKYNGSLMLITIPPNYCPECGHWFQNWDILARNDFKAACSHICPECGLKFQFAEKDLIINTADEQGGDMREMIDRGI